MRVEVMWRLVFVLSCVSVLPLPLVGGAAHSTAPRRSVVIPLPPEKKQLPYLLPL